MKGQFFPYKDENVAKNRPYITWALIAVNVIVFAWSLFNFDYIINTFGFTPANFVIITLFTSMFLHGGLDHIFGNMWYLWIFGDNVEDKFGKVKYIVFYIMAGLAAALTQYLTDPTSTVPTIGASGAISGVLGAYFALFPRVNVRVASYFSTFRIPAWAVIGFWFVLQFILGTVSFLGGVGSGIAFWAHVGGFVFGFAVTWILKSAGVVKV